MHLNALLQHIARRIKQFFSRPDDPHEYAMVGARVRPKLPTLKAKAILERQ